MAEKKKSNAAEKTAVKEKDKEKELEKETVKESKELEECKKALADSKADYLRLMA